MTETTPEFMVDARGLLAAIGVDYADRRNGIVAQRLQDMFELGKRHVGAPKQDRSEEGFARDDKTKQPGHPLPEGAEICGDQIVLANGDHVRLQYESFVVLTENDNSVHSIDAARAALYLADAQAKQYAPKDRSDPLLDMTEAEAIAWLQLQLRGERFLKFEIECGVMADGTYWAKVHLFSITCAMIVATSEMLVQAVAQIKATVEAESIEQGDPLESETT